MARLGTESASGIDLSGPNLLEYSAWTKLEPDRFYHDTHVAENKQTNKNCKGGINS